MPTFINIKAGFPKTISWESNSVHTSHHCRWLTQFYSSIKNELIMQTPKSWDVARSRGKTIYLHRRNYDGAPWIKYVAGCQSDEDVVCDGRQGCQRQARGANCQLPVCHCNTLAIPTDKYFLTCIRQCLYSIPNTAVNAWYLCLLKFKLRFDIVYKCRTNWAVWGQYNRISFTKFWYEYNSVVIKLTYIILQIYSHCYE